MAFILLDTYKAYKSYLEFIKICKLILKNVPINVTPALCKLTPIV